MKRLQLIGLLLLLLTSRPAIALKATQIYREAAPAVVLIIGQNQAKDKQGSVGTGSIITSDGHIITNAHVVIAQTTGKPYPRLRAYLKPEEVTGKNSEDLQNAFLLTCNNWHNELDLALCKIENSPPYDLPFLTFSSTNEIDIGSEVLAIGHPEGGALWTLTSGKISSRIQSKDKIPGKDVFQTEVSINRGNSGGPLLNEYGQIVGINTEMVRKSQNDGLAITAVNFALQSPVVVRWLKMLGLPIQTK